MYIDKFFNTDYELQQPLPKEELYKLLKEADDGSRDAKEKIIIHNIRLVLYEVANKFQNVNYDKKDLVSLGNIGLIKAINSYDISKGTEFTYYAIKCIDNEILMLLRQIKKDRLVDSIEKVVSYDDEGRKIKIEDKLSNNSNFMEEYEKFETYEMVRELVSQLPDKDKEIVMLYFGFYDGKKYSQSKIAEILHLSQPQVSRIISRAVKKIGNQLKAAGMIELHTKAKNNKKKIGRSKLIYEYFENYTREQVNEMLTKLTEEERILIKHRYGENLDKTVQSELTIIESNKFYQKLIPKMKKLLASLNDESSIQLQPTLPIKEITKDDYIKIQELLQTQTFKKMLNRLTEKEAIIISLKSGHIDGKCFSTKSIAQFLEIEETEVIEIEKKALLLYKESINNYLDSTIEVATNNTNKNKALSINQ